MPQLPNIESPKKKVCGVAPHEIISFMAEGEQVERQVAKLKKLSEMALVLERKSDDLLERSDAILKRAHEIRERSLAVIKRKGA